MICFTLYKITDYRLQVTVAPVFLSPVICHLSPDFAGGKI